MAYLFGSPRGSAFAQCSLGGEKALCSGLEQSAFPSLRARSVTHAWHRMLPALLLYDACSAINLCGSLAVALRRGYERLGDSTVCEYLGCMCRCAQHNFAKGPAHEFVHAYLCASAAQWLAKRALPSTIVASDPTSSWVSFLGFRLCCKFVDQCQFSASMGCVAVESSGSCSACCGLVNLLPETAALASCLEPRTVCPFSFCAYAAIRQTLANSSASAAPSLRLQGLCVCVC